MREALKYQQKSRNIDKDVRIESLNRRIALTEKFSEARSMMNNNPQGAVAACNELLMEAPDEMQDAEASIRIGDVFAMLVEYWYGQRNMEQSYQLIEKMRDRRIILSPYLDSQMVNAVYQAMGVKTPMAAENDDGIDDEEIPMDDEEFDDEE